MYGSTESAYGSIESWGLGLLGFSLFSFPELVRKARDFFQQRQFSDLADHIATQAL